MNIRKGSFLAISLSVLFLIAFYGKVLQNPNKYLFTGDGDGLMTYYSIHYHTKVDDSYSGYKGFNYPYGDLYNFTDGQPILADTIKLIGEVFPGIYDYSSGILNFCILFSFVLTAFFLYKILIHHGVTWWFAAIFAVFISILCPQAHRIVSHPSLPYSFFLPATWFLYLKYGGNLSYYKSILIGVFNLCLFFIHPYLGIISMFFLICLGGLDLLKNKKNWKQDILHLGIRSFTGIIGFFGFIKIMGQGKERPVNFFELYTYNAEISSILLPNSGSIVKETNNLFGLKGETWESWAFIGFPALIVLLLVVIRLLFKVQVKSTKTLFKRKYTSIWIIAGLTLLIAFGVPYKLGLYGFLDKFPALAQIRVLARFSWLFFLLINVYAVVYYYKVYRKYQLTGKRIHSFLLVGVMVILYWVSAYPMQRMVSDKVDNQENLFAHSELDPELSEIINISSDIPQEYDAIIALPFYHFSDRFAHKSTVLAFQYSKFLAYQVEKPLVNSSMTRTPNEYIESINELFGMHLKQSKLKDHVIGKKALILRQKIWLDPAEGQILKKSIKVGETKNFELYTCNFEDLLEQKNEEVMNNFLAQRDNLFKINNCYVKDSTDLLYYNNFEHLASDSTKSLAGKGGLKGHHLDYTVLFTDIDRKLDTGINYEIKYWYYSKSREAFSIMGVLEEQKGKDIDWTKITDTKYSYDHVGDWTYASFIFQQKTKESKVKYFLKGHIFEDPDLYVDQVMVKKRNADVYSIENDTLYFNNYPVGKLPKE